MDYSKTRCPICLKRFCCVEHKNAHLKKEHPEYLKRSSQEYLLKSFQKKAQRMLLNAQKYKALNMKIDGQQNQNPVNTNTANTNINTNTNKVRPAIKRLHSEMNQQIISTSITITSEIRKVLIPAHRTKGKVLSNSEIKPKLKAFVQTTKLSPCETGLPVVKTSTPIVKNQLVQSTPQNNSWNISQTSSISSYHTPSTMGDQKATVYQTPINCDVNYQPGIPMPLKSQIYQTKKTVASPRSIMSKTSKYKDEVGPNMNPNISKCRRVTFSFASSNSSPLESLQEVDIGKDEDDCVFEYDGQLYNNVETKNLSNDCNQETDKLQEDLYLKNIEKYISKTPSDIMNEMSHDENDSSLPEKTKSGFFNCVTNMICSAVPLFASWRGFASTHSNNGNRSKRSRSPDRKFVGVEVIRSPEYKRLCYPYDLRLNPIKSRKSISQQ